MDFFDILKELRTGDPDIQKACKAMKVLGWICVVGAIWNFAIFHLAPFDKSPFNISPSFPYISLISLLFLGGLCLYSSQAIRNMNATGKKVGQVAVVLLVALPVGSLFFLFPMDTLPVNEGPFSIFFIIFMTIFLAQFCIPAFYGVRYLGRLPTQEGNFEEMRFKPESVVKGKDEGGKHDNSTPPGKYKDALFPFGLFGTSALLIAIPLLCFFAIDKVGDPNQIGFMVIPVFFFIFLSPISYNFFPSPFQKQRTTIAAYTGGGSIFLFNGSWPFFRLLVYADGLEVRIMFHRFFIPYDKMDEIPEKVGLFSRGILIKSNLPGVPSGIRYQGFGMKKIVEVIIQNKKRYKTQTIA